MIDVKIRKVHPDAVIPTYAHPGDAGMDVTAVAINITDNYIEYDTGLQFQLPAGYVMLIFPRSSNSKKDLLLANSVGLLDSGYTGNLKLRFKHIHSHSHPTSDEQMYNIGDRVGQRMIVPYPEINFIETEDFEDTERGSGGFGSSGN
jgi:dUTP pyrophosphatase